MALRGQGSLQQLVGRAFTKSGFKRQDSKAGGDSVISNFAAAVGHQDAACNTRDAEVIEIAESEQVEGIRCPVCSLKLSEDNSAINSHIDACLTKGSLRKGRQQTTLLQFARRRPAQQRPAAPRVSQEPPAAPGSSRLQGGASSALCTAQTAQPSGPSRPSAASAPTPGPRCTSPQRQGGQSPSCSWDSQGSPACAAPAAQPHAASQQQQQQALQGQEEQSPARSSTAATLGIPHCLVVGRQYQSAAVTCSAGQRVAVQWEEGNPRDPQALLVTHPLSGAAVGHLPFAVARHLAPLVRWQGVVVEGVVLEDPPSDKAPLAVELQVSLPGPPLSPAGKSRPKLEAAVQQAQQAAAEHAQQQGAGALTAGSRLRANFLTVLETVLQHDSHLLDEAELGFARAFQDLDPPAASLLLRLFQRRGPWFRAGTLSYAEVPDVPAALSTLCMAGMMHMVHENGGTTTSFAAAGTILAATAANGVEVAAANGAAATAAEKGAAAAACSAEAEQALMPSSCGDSDDDSCIIEVVDDDGDAGPSTSASATCDAAGAAGRAQQVQSAAGQLEQDASTAPSISWGELADLLTVPELGAVLVSAVGLGGGQGPASGVAIGRAGAGGNRAQVLEAVRALAGRDVAAARRALLQATGDVVRLSERCCKAINRIQRLFFLNEGHTLSQFLAADLGGVRYPEYSVQRSRSAFASRSALLRYERALHQAEALNNAVEAGDLETTERVLQHAWAALDVGDHKQRGAAGEELPLFLKRFHAGWVYCIMATVGVSLLERQRKYGEATERLQQLLGGDCCPGRRGEWWLRLSMDTEHLGRPEASLEIAEAALADAWLSHGDRLALQRRVLRLGKPPRRWRTPAWAEAALREPRERRIEGRPLASAVGLKSRFYGPDGEQCSVEELALQYYASDEGGGWAGVHSEGGIWATLFGLLLWDVLFAPGVPDVLRTRFQTAPLDLDTDAFFAARQGAIEAALARVGAGEAPDMLQHTWQAQLGTLCRGVSWDRHSLQDLQLVARCVGGPGLAAVCRLLAQDHAGWSGGMPDLLLWHAGRCEALLAEVKGPRDRLSDQQRAWMNALAGAGLACEVLKVVEPKKRKA